MARCPSCGHESDLDTYVCDNCGYKLKVEKIEAIPMFRRPSDRWYKPDKRFVRLVKVINPLTTSHAFRDINNKKDRGGPRFITWFNGFLIGLCALAVSWHVSLTEFADNQFITIITDPAFDIEFDPGKVTALLIGLAIFLCFFIFGMVYYFIVFQLYNFAFSTAANFSVQLDGLLAIRFNIKLKKNKLTDLVSGKSRLEKKAGIEEGAVSFEASKSKKKNMTKISQTGKNKIMGYAYTPFIIVNFLSFLLLAIFLPTDEIANISNVTSGSIATTMSNIWASPLWMILDLLQLLGLLWVACTMSIAQREIGNTSTTRLLIGNVIMALLIGFTTILLRPNVGAGDWNLIEVFSNLISPAT
jgi:hypothetical protein